MYLPTFPCRHVAFLFTGKLVVIAFASHKHFGLVYVRQNRDCVGIKQHRVGQASKIAFSTIQEPYFHSRPLDVALLLKVSCKGLPVRWLRDSSVCQPMFSWPRNSSNFFQSFEKFVIEKHIFTDCLPRLGKSFPDPLKLYKRFLFLSHVLYFSSFSFSHVSESADESPKFVELFLKNQFSLFICCFI
jgi:hypothetical protein